MDSGMLQKELIIRSIKILDLGYIGAIQFVTGFGLAQLVDKKNGKFDKVAEAKKSTLRVILELLGLLWIDSIIIYIAKNVLELIPFPLDGVGGFNHHLMKELDLVPLLIFAFLYYQTYLEAKCRALYERFQPPSDAANNSSEVRRRRLHYS